MNLGNFELGRFAQRNDGMLIALATLASVFIVLELNLDQGFGYSDVRNTFSSSGTLALAAMGATLVILIRGLDLSVGAVISLSNCLIAANVSDTRLSMIGWAALGVAAGAATGLFNGIFVVFLRLPSVIVSLASMFIVEGICLLILDQPGGSVPQRLVDVFTGDTIAGILPAPAAVILGALALWVVIRATRLGTYIYAVGSNEDAARSKGVPVKLTQILVYVIAGGFYGAAGLFLTAQTGSGDPTVGQPMLLPVFVAVVLGGTSFAGGRGGCIGSVFGAFTVMLIVNLLLVFNVPTFYATIVEGGLLIAAVLANSFGRVRQIFVSLKIAILNRMTRAGRYVRPPITFIATRRSDDTLPKARMASWYRTKRSELRFVIPTYVGLVVLLITTAILFNGRLSLGTYLNTILVLGSFLAVLGLGQGAVVISGGLDLSIPATITLSGVLLCQCNAFGLHVVPAIALVIVVGCLIGMLNGIGVGLFGVHPLIMTLAMNGILDGTTLVMTDGTPQGVPPIPISWFMTGKFLGFAPVAYGLILFVAVAIVLLERSRDGRMLYMVGSNETAAWFSGVNVGKIRTKAYVASGICSALVGMMLAGFSGQAFIDMGTPYLLPSIAVIVLGGVAMTGGRGTYVGILGGALLLTVLSTILQGMLLPVALRNIVFGMVILGAIIGLRDKRN